MNMKFRIRIKYGYRKYDDTGFGYGYEVVSYYQLVSDSFEYGYYILKEIQK